MTIALCNMLNPATLLPPLPSDKTPHDCLTLTDRLLTPRIDFQVTPLENAECSLAYWWFLPKRLNRPLASTLCNCLSKRNHWGQSNALGNFCSTSRALWIYLNLHIGQRENGEIYTDNRYAFGIAHVFGMLQLRGFWRLLDKRLRSSYILELLEAIQLPTSLAIIAIINIQWQIRRK